MVRSPERLAAVGSRAESHFGVFNKSEAGFQGFRFPECHRVVGADGKSHYHPDSGVASAVAGKLFPRWFALIRDWGALQVTRGPRNTTKDASRQRPPRVQRHSLYGVVGLMASRNFLSQRPGFVSGVGCSRTTRQPRYQYIPSGRK